MSAALEAADETPKLDPAKRLLQLLNEPRTRREDLDCYAGTIPVEFGPYVTLCGSQLGNTHSRGLVLLLVQLSMDMRDVLAMGTCVWPAETVDPVPCDSPASRSSCLPSRLNP